MQWQLYPDKATRLKEISDAAKQADRLILATDPDREGDAISWHVQELLRSKKALPAPVDRVPFTPITKQPRPHPLAHPPAPTPPLTHATHAPPTPPHPVSHTLHPD